MEVEINWVAVVLAAVASMVVGSVWYAKPVFGEKWSKLVGLKEAQQKQGAAKAIMIAFVAALVTAYVLAHVTELSHAFYDVSEMSAALTTAFWLWVGVSATTLVTHHAFEQRPMQLTVLAVGNQLVTLLVMGLVIGAL